MISPTFDKDRYPTEETLRVIEDWSFEDPNGWLDFCKEAFLKPYGDIHDYIRTDFNKIRTVIFITGGWSGNESVISSMRNNLLWFITWRQSCSGGMHTFETIVKG